MPDKKVRVGINGFGRIGRIASRIILERSNLELVAINSRADVSSHAYLLKYDSTYGIFPKKVTVNGNNLEVDGKKVSVFAANEPKDIPWKEAGADLVIDATGKFRTKQLLQGHIEAGVRRVVLSSPAKDDMKTLVIGVNHQQYNPATDTVLSNSSCTTNCLATTIKVLHDSYTIKRGFMTTTHSVTDSQNLLDNSHKKEVRLRRSAFQSLIPASTGSAKDIGKLYPDLAGSIVCQALRIPIPTVSMITLTVEIAKDTTVEDVNETFLKASQENLKGILAVTTEELVSRDFIGNTNSSIVDATLTRVIGGNLVNVYAWYDNEWGYTSRLVDMVEYIGRKE